MGGVFSYGRNQAWQSAGSDRSSGAQAPNRCSCRKRWIAVTSDGPWRRRKASRR